MVVIARFICSLNSLKVGVPDREASISSICIPSGITTAESE